MKIDPEQTYFIQEYWQGLIAVLALVLSMISLWIQRTHNRNSVRPIINLSRYKEKGRYKVKIENKGLGPALISNIQYKKYGESLDHDAFCYRITKIRQKPSNWNFSAGFTAAVEPGAHMLALNLDLDKHKNLDSNIEGWDLHIEYKDLYGKPFTRVGSL
ncbi:hypothetical protein [Roseivirga sp. E12]|uniref:hypothetical protein n=1 Tax=Roseivirga sp. E12 TaxID=2819237 RepID=UPI001ABCD530|nr:hypothetical protein [Roseivirga sp. E12]MBO3699697.1 hypothetical protein [Roseivirga sp. E12]